MRFLSLSERYIAEHPRDENGEGKLARRQKAEPKAKKEHRFKFQTPEQIKTNATSFLEKMRQRRFESVDFDAEDILAESDIEELK